MHHISLTPFGRQPVTAAHLAAARLAQAPAPLPRVCKWTLLRDLTAARAAFGLRDRALTVLSALLSFLPEAELADGRPLVVHPSNARLGERAHGMAESTLRRHLAALVAAGMIARHDSPNGKRYAAHGPDGRVAFGFDLRPLLVQAPRIAAAAEAARSAALQLRRLREATVIALRDAAKLLTWAMEAGHPPAICAPFGARHAELGRRLRRKLPLEDLRALHSAALAMRGDLKALIVIENTEDSGGSDRQIERHIQTSDKDIPDSEAAESEETPHAPPLPLALVLKAAPDVEPYSPDGVRNWRDLVRLGHTLHPMLGIDRAVWHDACRTMGAEAASVTLACMVQRARHIHRPGAYLRRLTMKAAEGTFSPLPMVMALLRAGPQTA